MPHRQLPSPYPHRHRALTQAHTECDARLRNVLDVMRHHRGARFRREASQCPIEQPRQFVALQLPREVERIVADLFRVIVRRQDEPGVFPPLPSCPAQADIARDSEEPRGGTTLVVELPPVSPCLRQRLLGKVLSSVRIAGETRARAYEPHPLRSKDRLEIRAAIRDEPLHRPAYLRMRGLNTAD